MTTPKRAPINCDSDSNATIIDKMSEGNAEARQIVTKIVTLVGDMQAVADLAAMNMRGAQIVDGYKQCGNALPAFLCAVRAGDKSLVDAVNTNKAAHGHEAVYLSTPSAPANKPALGQRNWTEFKIHSTDEPADCLNKVPSEKGDVFVISGHPAPERTVRHIPVEQIDTVIPYILERDKALGQFGIILVFIKPEGDFGRTADIGQPYLTYPEGTFFNVSSSWGAGPSTFKAEHTRKLKEAIDDIAHSQPSRPGQTIPAPSPIP